MFSKDIGIDLGTANILIYQKGLGIVLNEPSVVALDRETKKPLAIGNKAKEMVGKTPEEIMAIKPMKDGVIANFEVTELMLNNFLKKVKSKGLFSKPNILICCPSNITDVEKNAIKEAAERLGAKKVYLEEEPKVAAIGAGMNIYEPSGNMVIDIGGGTTNVAVLSMGGIVTSSSIKVAGNTFDNDIIKYIKDKYKLLIGDKTAEEIKFKISEDKNVIEVKGRDLVSGLPNTVKVNIEEVEESLKESLYTIIRTAKSVLEHTPPELAADIVNKGIVITGGGALLKNIDELFSRELNVPVLLAESPLTCVVEGTGILLNNL